MRRRAALAVLPAVLLLAGCAGTDPAASADPPSSSAVAPSGSAAGSATPAAEESGRRIEAVVEGGRVSGDTGRVPVAVGETVTLVVTSDAADEVHVHGYDLTAQVVAGRPATLTFPTDVPGVFEVELHEAGTRLLSLQVG